jgi:hypothetical protein
MPENEAMDAVTFSAHQKNSAILAWVFDNMNPAEMLDLSIKANDALEKAYDKVEPMDPVLFEALHKFLEYTVEILPD